MASEKASVQISLDGADAVVSDARKAENAINSIGSGAVRAGKAVAGSMAGAVGSAMQLAAAATAINFGKGMADAKQLDLTVARLARTAGTTGDALKAGFEKAERSTLTSSLALADFSKALGRTTYDGKYAAGSVAALGDHALALGRELGDELPLAVALHGIGVEAEKLPAELGRIRDMADRLGTVGGAAALGDTLAALGPQLATVATQSDASKAKLEALIATMTKGLRPDQAKQVGGEALSMVKSRALDIERLTGKRVIDDNGQLTDPTEALASIKKIAQKKFGGNQEAMRRALMSEFGSDLGLSIMRTDFNSVGKTAAAAQNTGKTAQEAEAFRQSTEGKRIDAELQRQVAGRAVGGKIQGALDTATDTLGPVGTTAALYGSGKALGYVGGKLLAGGGTASGGAGTAAGTGAGTSLAAGLGTVVTSGLGLSAAVGVGSLALQGGVLSEIGQDRDTMGKDWRSKHAQTLGSELAQQAIQRGDLSGVIGKAGGDKEVIAAMLTTLEGSLDKLPAAMAQQVAAGIAAELKRAPLKAIIPQDPNAPKGN